MRWIFILLVLAGCAERPEAVAQSPHDKCVEYGFKPGTTPFAECLLTLDQMAAEEKARKKAIVIQQLLQ